MKEFIKEASVLAGRAMILIGSVGCVSNLLISSLGLGTTDSINTNLLRIIASGVVGIGLLLIPRSFKE